MKSTTVQSGSEGNPKRPRRSYARWRAATLTLVYFLMAAHVTHWIVAGKTLAPLELNEVMYTLELGIITAGFLFMAAVTLATLVVGRFFCSWGCHVLALQDLCHWLLGKLRLRPRPIRSRAMMWVPMVAAVYMFAWPQFVRVTHARPLPQLHFRTDAEGWASLTTEHFWRNLPSPPVTLLTFGVCGFLIVYVLGSRGFCAYGCPYGAVFRVADRLSPGRIRTNRDCLSCGACTAVCKSNIRVHEELNRFGMVVSSACLKDLDCVAACPQGNVHFGFGRPAMFKTVQNDTPVRKKYDFSLWEECVMIAVFIFILLTYRGLYDRVPFLLSLGLGTIVAHLVILTGRLIRRPDLQWNRLVLKQNKATTWSGSFFLAAMAVFAIFTMHSAFLRYHSFQGKRLAGRALSDIAITTRAADHLEVARRWALLPTESDDRLYADLQYQLAGNAFRSQRAGEAEAHLRSALAAKPDFAMANYDLGGLLLKNGQLPDSIRHFQAAVQAAPDFADGHYNLGLAYWMSGAANQARVELDAAYRLNPKDEQIRQLHDLIVAAGSGQVDGCP